MVTKPAIRTLLPHRILVLDGAMGTMIQDASPSMDDFQNYEGCNEILNVTRPDIISSIHAQYLKAGAEAIETNTFGANFANLAEYGIEDRIYELAFAGGKIAREAADSFSTSTGILSGNEPIPTALLTPIPFSCPHTSANNSLQPLII